uniref:C2H2-type domain-containing protein n=1 Tax=Trichogramma kaykai TaxID=54128 RepID=A0ABD2XDL4_9HYME
MFTGRGVVGRSKRKTLISDQSSSTSASAAASSTASSASAAAAPAPTTSASSSTPAVTAKEDNKASSAATAAAAATDSEPVAQVVMQAPGRFSCSLCGSVYKHLASLTQHLEVHRNQTTCVLCHTTLSRKTDLRRHMRLKHNLQWQKSLQRHRAPRRQSST